MKKWTLFLVAALAAAPAFADKKLDDAVAKAESLVDKGKPDDALKTIQHAEEAAKAAPASASALAALARAQARTKDAPTALATADKAVQAGANSGIAHVARGEALLAMGRAKDAEAEFRKALEVDPKLT